MPVSVVCESASVNNALRESLANSASSCGQQHNEESLQNKLVASAKRVLLSKIEYEEVNNYSQSVLDTLKSKYTVLKPTNGGKLQTNDSAGTQTNCTATSAEKTQKNPNELPQPKRILYPRENIQIGWKGSNRKWHIGAGMANVGNTCYLNSTLQALFHVPAIANWLVSDSEHRQRCEDMSGSSGGCIICAMATTLINSQGSQSSIRPHLIYSKLRQICKHLIMGRQEDAHEFLRYLMEAMEKSYLLRIRGSKDLDQYSKETTPLNQILGGYLKSAVGCLACGHISTTFQHFEDLMLDIRKADTVEEALEVHFARERLEDMGYKCESCKKKVSATKQFFLERAPISLCIQLKRFSMVGTKLNKHITIRPRLDLSKYSSKRNSENLTYRLVSMVTHLGASQHCGHYTAIGLTESGTYYQFDDSSVRPISIQNVMNTSGYIIFYELENANTQISRQTSTQVSGSHEQSKENVNRNGYATPLRTTNLNVTSPGSTNKTISGTPNKIIGPQLPDNMKNGEKPILNGHVSKLVNGKTPVTPSSTGNSKIAIHFKAAQSASSSSVSKFQVSPKLTATANSSKAQSSYDDELTITNDDRSTLPSMPKLGPLSTPKSPIVTTSASTSNLTKTSGLTNGHATNSSNTKSPMKSLVPYESESDESDEDEADNDDSKKLPLVKRTDNATEQKSDNNANNKNHSNTLYDSEDDDDNKIKDDEPPFKRCLSTPPSPPVVKTKTGLWQVTSVRPISASASPPEKKYTNPFVTQSSTSASNLFTRRPKVNEKEKKTNIVGGVTTGDDKAVNELLKFSNRGYGAPVLSWNGQKTDMEKEITEEVRLERKREIQDEEENEMDRGRQKKVKLHAPVSRDNSGFNPFQEHQNQQNGNNRRWKFQSGGGNRFHHNNGSNNNSSSNFRNNNFNNNRNSNNFKRFNNKFHQRPHHQRNHNNASDFHRRES